MNKLILAVVVFVVFSSCKETKKANQEESKLEVTEDVSSGTVDNEQVASKKIDLTNKGIGPVKELVLEEQINEEMAKLGAEVFKKMCSACHKVGSKFIGPAPNGILKRRTPEWVMNMILNPTEMVQKDPLAKQLLMEFNGSPMANQNLSREDARAILEYFRTL